MDDASRDHSVSDRVADARQAKQRADGQRADELQAKLLLKGQRNEAARNECTVDAAARRAERQEVQGGRRARVQCHMGLEAVKRESGAVSRLPEQLQGLPSTSRVEALPLLAVGGVVASNMPEGGSAAPLPPPHKPAPAFGSAAPRQHLGAALPRLAELPGPGQYSIPEHKSPGGATIRLQPEFLPMEREKRGYGDYKHRQSASDRSVGVAASEAHSPDTPRPVLRRRVGANEQARSKSLPALGRPGQNESPPRARPSPGRHRRVAHMDAMATQQAQRAERRVSPPKRVSDVFYASDGAEAAALRETCISSYTTTEPAL